MHGSLDDQSTRSSESRNFERAGLAKLEGCYTRWREYRWGIFEPYLDALHSGDEALDVGCGSLVETHYLARRGLAVTGIDLEAKRLESYRNRYDWMGLRPPTLRGASLDQISGEPKRYALVTAFDVIEHLPDLPRTIRALKTLLAPNGLVFATVPNKLSATELQGAITYRALRAVGRSPAPGVAHVQFNSPDEWRAAFLEGGLEPIAWEMAIGPLVNTFAAAVLTPITTSLMALELVGALRRSRRHELLIDVQYVRPLQRIAERINRLDEALRPYGEFAFAWNLVVLKRGQDGETS